MPRALWLVDAAKATGYPVKEVSGWTERGYSSGFYPRVTVWHHTAGPATGDMPSLNVIVNGRAGLPGPLANYGLGRSGTIYVVASGKSNNAGVGGWKGSSSNYHTIGIEAENTGLKSDPWPEAQLDSYVKLSAEIANFLQHKDAGLMCSHEEWATPPGRKVDPHSIPMDEARLLVQSVIDGTYEGDQPMSLWAFCKIGDVGQHVKAWQRKLNDLIEWLQILGDDEKPLTPLKLDSEYGPLTADAVLRVGAALRKNGFSSGDEITEFRCQLMHKGWEDERHKRADHDGAGDHKHDGRYVRLNQPVTVAKA